MHVFDKYVKLNFITLSYLFSVRALASNLIYKSSNLNIIYLRGAHVEGKIPAHIIMRGFVSCTYTSMHNLVSEKGENFPT